MQLGLNKTMMTKVRKSKIPNDVAHLDERAYPCKRVGLLNLWRLKEGRSPHAFSTVKPFKRLINDKKAGYVS